jgi:hypothetical protein
LQSAWAATRLLLAKTPQSAESLETNSRGADQRNQHKMTLAIALGKNHD